MGRLKTRLGLLILLLGLSSIAVSAPYNIGPKKCKECHEPEVGVWEGTKHFKSYKTTHKSAKAKKILAAVGGGKSMKKSKTCTLCHYTLIKKSEGKKAKARAGTSCESCHGAASEWLDVHSNFGGANAKAANETAAHKKQRLAAARKAGMIMSFMHYDIASNCMSCHGLANDKLAAKDLAAMLDAGHPLNPDFELVRYSQGSVRHRFYPPDISKNAKMSNSELARFFVTGQAAKLVSASAAIANAANAKYKTAQRKRLDAAKKALSAVKSVPQAAALVAEPNEANARKLMAAIRKKDLYGEIGKLLPAAKSYK